MIFISDVTISQCILLLLQRQTFSLRHVLWKGRLGIFSILGVWRVPFFFYSGWQSLRINPCIKWNGPDCTYCYSYTYPPSAPFFCDTDADTDIPQDSQRSAISIGARSLNHGVMEGVG